MERLFLLCRYYFETINLSESYLQLIKQLTSADSAIEREIDTVLQRMERGEDISTMHGDGKRQKIIRVSTKKYVVLSTFC